jgi:hypothetical protein
VSELPEKDFLIAVVQCRQYSTLLLSSYLSFEGKKTKKAGYASIIFRQNILFYATYTSKDVVLAWWNNSEIIIIIFIYQVKPFS